MAPATGEYKKVAGESVQFQVLPHQGVQPVKALAHVAGRKAQIHPHAGWQVNHTRNASSTVRKVTASTPAPIRSRSPVASTSSRLASAAGSCLTPPRSTKAKRTAPPSPSRLRQALKAHAVSPCSLQNSFTDNPLRSCAVSRSRHCSLLVVAFSSLTVSVMKPLCSPDRPLGRGVHRTLTFYQPLGRPSGIELSLHLAQCHLCLQSE